MSNNKDDFGDRMKLYENAGCGARLMPLLPAIIRLDGKNFSRFTKGLERPYDARLSKLMLAVTHYLVDETNALIGYTQSDEISLILYSPSAKSQIHFDGRIQKIVSDAAAMASVQFNRLLADSIPEKAHLAPRFDCRAWNVPNKVEAANAILWREQDATKNSISMAARAHYSHKQLHRKTGDEMQDMLMEKGVNWNDYPEFFKRGVFVRRDVEQRRFTATELDQLPLKHEARSNPDLIIERKVIREMLMPPFGRVTNRVEVIFDGFRPTTFSAEEQKLRRYGFLCGYPARNAAEDDEMQSLRAELTAAGITPGWDEVPTRHSHSCGRCGCPGHNRRTCPKTE